jgi:hypothetical protein
MIAASCSSLSCGVPFVLHMLALLSGGAYCTRQPGQIPGGWKHLAIIALFPTSDNRGSESLTGTFFLYRRKVEKRKSTCSTLFVTEDGVVSSNLLTQRLMSSSYYVQQLAFLDDRGRHATASQGPGIAFDARTQNSTGASRSDAPNSSHCYAIAG